MKDKIKALFGIATIGLISIPVVAAPILLNNKINNNSSIMKVEKNKTNTINNRSLVVAPFPEEEQEITLQSTLKKPVSQVLIWSLVSSSIALLLLLSSIVLFKKVTKIGR